LLATGVVLGVRVGDSWRLPRRCAARHQAVCDAAADDLADATSERSPAACWDAEYRAGRNSNEPPVAFAQDIAAAARQAGVARGLYVGCGNGRNYLPLVEAGLGLTGLDISAAAISQLAARVPGRRDRLICGDLDALPADAGYPLVIGIQVFQHGDRATTHAHIRAAQTRVTPGGLFCCASMPLAPTSGPNTRQPSATATAAARSVTSPGQSKGCPSTSSPPLSWTRCSPPGWLPYCRCGCATPAVSCPSPASGSVSTSGGGFGAWVVSERNGVWGTPGQVPGLAVLNTGHAASVNSVSCAPGPDQAQRRVRHGRVSVVSVGRPLHRSRDLPVRRDDF
jgi:hypothetical protein